MRADQHGEVRPAPGRDSKDVSFAKPFRTAFTMRGAENPRGLRATPRASLIALIGARGLERPLDPLLESPACPS
jgi:hypothetical protein